MAVLRHRKKAPECVKNVIGTRDAEGIVYAKIKIVYHLLTMWVISNLYDFLSFV